jgi:hypothetical protein
MVWVKGTLCVLLAMISAQAQAGVTLSPYVSLRSTKAIKPVAGDRSKESSQTQQRQEAGLRGSLKFWRLFGVMASAGQSKVTTTVKTQEAVDEYGEIDYNKDLNVSTDNPDSEVKTTETQRNARLTAFFDPGFWIFIMRARLGVTATQRLLEVEETGKDKVTKVFGPTYKPNTGVGFGIKFTPNFYAMAEYNFFHYKFPEWEPFERELALSVNISL